MNQQNPYQPPKAEVSDVHSGDETELASRWARFGGSLLDGVVMMLVLMPAMYATGYWQEAMAGHQPGVTLQIQLVLLAIASYVVLNGYLLTKSGQTIGKRLVGTRIVAVDDNRILPLWKVFVLRYLPITVAAQIPMAGSVVNLLDAVFVFRPDKRCVHDLIAGTKVIKATAPWKALNAE